jgi:transposase
MINTVRAIEQEKARLDLPAVNPFEAKARRRRDLLLGRDVHEIEELKRQGLSIRAISRLTGYCRKSVLKYLIEPDSRPVYGPRQLQAGKLDAFKSYLEERMRAGVWNARVLLRELQQRSYAGSYTILTDWLRPQRESARTVAVRRFETPAGKQGQVDCGHLGTLEMGGEERKIWASHSRWATAAR